MSLSREQRQIVEAILAEGRNVKSAKKRKVYERAAVQTGLVESNLKNLSGGDADSAGWRQERKSLYKDPTNVRAAARRFRQEFQQHYDRGEHSYDVAAQVQRPAAQYRGRYKDRAKDAASILRKFGRGGGGGGSSTETTTTTTPGVNREGDRRRLLANFLLGNVGDPSALLYQMKSLKDTPGTTSTSRIVTKGALAGRKAQGPIEADGPTAKLIDRANAIDSKHMPYQWGGGHAGKVNPYKATPLDCSGAVSSVLGINPKVSGEFTKWGKAGRAPKGKGVTVYANGHHVLMEIDGHFFGTSGSNKGGGAGWIPRAKVPASYLASFTARHG